MDMIVLKDGKGWRHKKGGLKMPSLTRKKTPKQFENLDVLIKVFQAFFGVQKLTRISLKGVFEKGLFKDKFARFWGHFLL